ncbi:HAMP domain-containing sensor histidine kinase [Streptomyces diacarni]|uniref:sensor histidine kinase n=1 Tax=Streptomyces diacarni TaxID=2800381 RepID=UPI0033E38FD4
MPSLRALPSLRVLPGFLGRPRPPRLLRTRLVLCVLALIAVVAAVIGTVTTISLHSHLYRQLDDQLAEVAVRAAGPGPPGHGAPPDGDRLRFLTMGGQPLGTVGAVAPSGSGGSGRDSGGTKVLRAGISVQDDSAPTGHGVAVEPLPQEQRSALAHAPRDGEPHTAELPGEGTYRVRSVPVDGGTLLVGLPASGVQDTVSTLVVTEVCVACAGLIAAALVGTASVRLALRPLARVAQTATRVSRLPLHEGEVRLRERVPLRDTDPRSEVGQVAAALNRMLGHVGAALAARHESETRVRRFVADASHELRTPLASIRGYAELTRRGREEVGPQTRYALARVEAESERMTDLVEDLLLLARLDAGRPLSRSEVDLSALAVDAVSDSRAAGPDHRWQLDLPDIPVVVPGDAARLRQVLANLLTNARTHTPEGTVVTARLRHVPAAPGLPPPPDGGAPSGTAEIRVEDNGPGIPAEALPVVFERFARADASRSRAQGSTGLGLAIVRAVVAAHGGRVSAHSSPGRTVFTVGLPLGEGRAAAPPTPADDPPDPGGTAPVHERPPGAPPSDCA